jgi:hypothetical protein
MYTKQTALTVLTFFGRASPTSLADRAFFVMKAGPTRMVQGVTSAIALFSNPGHGDLAA